MVLQQRELGGVGLAEEVGACAEDLAEFNVGGAELGECLAQAAAQRGRLAFGGLHQAQVAQEARGEAVVEAEAAQEIGEAVAHKDLRDFRQADRVNRVLSQPRVVHARVLD